MSNPYPHAGDADPAAPLSRAKLPRNDLGNARRLAAVNRQDLRWLDPRGWIVWNGRYFDQQHGDLAADGLAQTLPDLIIEEARAMRARGDGDSAVKAHFAWATKSGAAARLSSALQLMRPMSQIRQNDLDADPGALVVENGVIDLRAVTEPDQEGETEEETLARKWSWLGEHSRLGAPTRIAGGAFDPEATRPEWDKFLALALPDLEMRRFAQKVSGSLLWGLNDAQICVLIRGRGGNGKSTFVDALAMVLGEYAKVCPITMFLENRYAASGPNPEEAALPGSRLYVASEPEAHAVLSAALIKGLTGGEPRSVRGLYSKPFTYIPNGTPLLAFNDDPRINDASEGIWRRLVYIAFDQPLHELPANERVSRFEMTRRLEAEKAGILNWMLEGYQLYRAEGLTPPQRARVLHEQLRGSTDVVGEFMRDCLEPRPGGRLPLADLHRVFSLWADEGGRRELSKAQFRRALDAKDVPAFKSSVMMRLGYDWITAAGAKTAEIDKPDVHARRVMNWVENGVERSGK